MITIEDFWRIDDQIQNKWGKLAFQHINYCGLEPIRPLQNRGYFCTPKNSLTFAATGGDGVHFGLVDGCNYKGTIGPIVMTVPMGNIQNVIVAEDLEEFFSLGYYVGWFALEQIVYDLADTIAYFSQSDEETTPEELLFLDILCKEFNLTPLPLSEQRLSVLEGLYFNKLDVGTF